MRSSFIALLLIIVVTGEGADWWSVDAAAQLRGSEKLAWEAFSASVKGLQDVGDRPQAAEAFERMAQGFPQSQYAKDAKEIAGLLHKMVEEDIHWKEPRDPTALPVEQKIAYYIYHLRDVNAYQISQPGMCSVLSDFGQKPRGPNAAMKLKEIGEPAIPALIQLLDDRRPTRSVGFWRNFRPSRTVLRFQDAAIEIIDALLPAPFYRRSSTAAYFSTESPEVREQVIHSIKTWHQKCQGKSPVERKWLMVEATPGIYPMITLLESLAFEHEEQDRVLTTLRQMCRQRDPLQLPQVSFLMCQLGDFGMVEAVATAYLSGKYGGATDLPDDSAAGSNAEIYALRQVILYGTARHHEGLKKNLSLKDDPLSKRKAIFKMLVDLAKNEWGELPKNYDRTRFPLGMLVDLLNSKEQWTNGSRGAEQWTIRRCDEAAQAIQKFTGKQFGFNVEQSELKKDEAITKILKWWKEQATEERNRGKM
jgi:hypothetical protein